MNQPLQSPVPRTRTPKQQSWGTVVSIAVIVLMVVVGAYYTWSKRVAEEHARMEAQKAITY